MSEKQKCEYCDYWYKIGYGDAQENWGIQTGELQRELHESKQRISQLEGRDSVIQQVIEAKLQRDNGVDADEANAYALEFMADIRAALLHHGGGGRMNFTFREPATEVIRFTPEGRIYVSGIEVETSDVERKAIAEWLNDFNKHLAAREQRIAQLEGLCIKSAWIDGYTSCAAGIDIEDGWKNYSAALSTTEAGE